MPEGWGGGGEGLQNGGAEKREGRGEKWMEQGEEGKGDKSDGLKKGVTLIQKAEPEKKEKKTACLWGRRSYFEMSQKHIKTTISYFLMNIVISRPQI